MDHMPSEPDLSPAAYSVADASLSENEPDSEALMASEAEGSPESMAAPVLVEPDWPAVPFASRPAAPRPASSRPTAASFFVVAVLAAVLASGGTYGILVANGVLDKTSAPAVATSTATPGAALASSAPTDLAQTSSLTNPTPDPNSTSASTPVVPAGSSIPDVVAAVSPTVVTIITSGTSAQLGPDSGSSGGTSIFGQLPSGQIPTGVGSGLIVGANGWILTNHHVVADGGTLTVRLADGRTYPAIVYGVDTLTDLALIKIKATGLPVANLGSSADLQVGDPVLAIGDPLGIYPGSVTNGIVSGLGRSIDVSGGTLDDLIQTDAAINPGNSGGPLLDALGNVIGLDVAESGSAQGVNFAIPIDLAKPLIIQALAGQSLSRPWLGIRYQMIDAGVSTAKHLSVNQGAWLTSDTSGGAAVEAGGPAAKAGLQKNDVITAVDGVSVTLEHPLTEVVAPYSVGDTITLSVARGSSTLSFKVILGARPASAQ